MNILYLCEDYDVDTGYDDEPSDEPYSGYSHEVRENHKTGIINLIVAKENVGRSSLCFHDRCPECHGTGHKQNGQSCIHMISCPCIKCNPYFC